MAKQQTTQGATDLATAYKSFFFDLPLASLKWSLGMNEEKDATMAVWKGYDAGVRLTTAAVDSLYRSPLFSDAFSRTLSTLLRWQRIGNAVSGAMFAGLWKAMGVPTADEIRGLSEQLRGVDHRLSQMLQKKDVQMLQDQVRALEARLPRQTPAVVRNNHREERAAA